MILLQRELQKKIFFFSVVGPLKIEVFLRLPSVAIHFLFSSVKHMYVKGNIIRKGQFWSKILNYMSYSHKARSEDASFRFISKYIPFQVLSKHVKHIKLPISLNTYAPISKLPFNINTLAKKSGSMSSKNAGTNSLILFLVGSRSLIGCGNRSLRICTKSAIFC